MARPRCPAAAPAAAGELFEALVARPTLAADQHQATSLTTGRLRLMPFIPVSGSSSRCNQIPFAALQRLSNWSLALGTILRVMAFPDAALRFRYCSKARKRAYSTPIASPLISPELLRLWLTNTRNTPLRRISARSRTLSLDCQASGPAMRALP